MRGLTLGDPALLGAAAGFSPLSLSPALWLDASDTSTITASSGAVSEWRDKSGNNRNFSQSTATNQPTTGASTQNGLNVINFASSSPIDGDFLQLGSNGLARNVQGATVYVVRKFSSSPSNLQVYLQIFSSSAGFARIHVSAGLTSYRSRTGGRTLDANTFASIIGTLAIGASWSIATAVYDYANTDLFAYLGASLDNSTSSFQTATTTSDTNSVAAYIGYDGSAQVFNAFQGSIAEIVVYHSAHDATTRQTVWDYLNAKWGL